MGFSKGNKLLIYFILFLSFSISFIGKIQNIEIDKEGFFLSCENGSTHYFNSTQDYQETLFICGKIKTMDIKHRTFKIQLPVHDK